MSLVCTPAVQRRISRHTVQPCIERSTARRIMRSGIPPDAWSATPLTTPRYTCPKNAAQHPPRHTYFNSVLERNGAAMKRSIVTAIGLGVALLAAPAFAQNHNDADKRVTVPKGNETVRRTVNERPNGTEVRRSVTERANGSVVNRTVRERPNGHVRVTRKVIRPARRFHAARP